VAAAFHNQNKDVHGLGRQGHKLVGAEQEPLGGVQAEVAELVEPSGRHELSLNEKIVRIISGFYEDFYKLSPLT
jgi:hypothetical protein